METLPANSRSRDWLWSLWPIVPLYPYGQRRTLRQEVVKDTIWTFDQLQGIFYVVVPIRMTVVKLETGGLLVYAPVAPTRECIRLVQELVAIHGDVKYIILPTVSGIEHKVFAGPFARRFPPAQVFVAPGQWSFPLNLPLSWLGLPWGRTQVLPMNSADAPFADQFDYTILGPLNLRLGWFGEVAFFHKRSGTLLVTDSVVSVPEAPPAIVELDPYPLLFHAKDNAFDVVENTEANRRKGWQRISLFTFYFQPSALDVIGWGQAFQDALKAPDRSKKAYFGLYPVQWKPDWQQSFEILRRGGRLFVAPVLQVLILNRGPREVIDWADQVASWNFQRIIPCHFDSPLTAAPRQFRQAFTFLEQQPDDYVAGKDAPWPEADLKVLKRFDAGLNITRITPPPRRRCDKNARFE
ncbi:MAG: DUF4336 domain-containing protein [Cyanothece sp. SIO1E1]|nr:DUF4336 domain-containing protein [Cyanothece sp. SIO1E1]